MPRIAVSTCHSRGGRAGRERRGLGEAEAQRAGGGEVQRAGLFLLFYTSAMHEGNVVDKYALSFQCPLIQVSTIRLLCALPPHIEVLHT